MARWLATRGWPVHPLATGQKTPAANCPACKDRSHAPAACPCHREGKWCHGFHSATTDTALITKWWTQEPGFGVGVACGPAHLVVLDVDAHAAKVPDRSRLLPGIPIPPQVNLTGLASGYDTLALLAAYRRQVNPAEDESTLRIRTPSGGLHIWYNSPPEIRYRSSTGSSPKVALAWQVDIRAHGSYIVAPGTRTTAGHRTTAGTYTPVGPAREPAALPDWLAGELQRTGHLLSEPGLPHPRRPRRTTRRPRPAAAHKLLQPLLDQVSECANVPQGASFTEKLNRAAYTAGGLAAAGHLDDEEARRLLTQAAQYARPGQPRRNENIISTGLSAGARHPLHPKEPHE
ncbi:bifunctional DNA primase/polymerase [Streptomyces lydicus]|uniref:bifunctional DNA primase/polymerase n=1 Tax=Streptomyces lydicus TaxID=47763 RepID=UPI0033DF256E